MSKAIVLIMFILFIGVGFMGVNSIMLGAAAKKWPTVEGEVAGVSVESEYHRRTKKRGDYYTYYDIITYKYLVNNNEYSLKERHDFAENKRLADSYVSSHPVGTKQTIYYNPSDPSRSMLDPSGAQIGGYSAAIFSFIMVIILGFVMFKAPQKAPK